MANPELESSYSFMPELPRMPGPDDRLFGPQQDVANNGALVNWPSSAWSLYASSYKEAGDVLVNKVESRSSGHDVLVYPILFLYRQYLELYLKLSIRTVRIFLDEGREIPTGHKIEQLWEHLDGLYRRAFPDQSTDALDQTGRLIREFAVVDPQSTAFRYPVDLKGNPSLPGLRSIDLVNVRDVIAKMDMLLGGAHTQAYEYLQWKLEMEREFRDDNCY
jgi:hypothetical protein